MARRALVVDEAGKRRRVAPDAVAENGERRVGDVVVAITEEVAAVATRGAITRSVDDVAAVSDAALRTLDAGRVLSDAVVADDAFGRTATFGRDASDPVDVTDGVTAGREVGRVVADTAGVTDTVTRAHTAARAAADATDVSDATTRTATFGRDASDAVVVTDAVARELPLERAVSDTAAVSDGVARTATVERAGADTASVADSVARTASLARMSSDSDTVTDAVAAGFPIERDVADSVVAADAVARTAALGRTMADSVTATDAVVRAHDALRPITDTAVVTDGATAVVTGDVTPITIFGAKLAAWYRPDAGHVTADGSNTVTQLDDRSGGARHLTVVNGTPLLTTDGGDPCIDFEADAAEGLGCASSPVSAVPVAFFAVATVESTGSARTLVGISQAAAAGTYWSLRTNSSPRANFTTNGSSSVTHGTTLSLGSTRYAIYAESASNTSRKTNVNGGTEATNTDNRTVTSLDYIAVGALRRSGAFNDHYDGLIFEIVVLNAIPSAGETAAYHAYTTDRFGTPP